MFTPQQAPSRPVRNRGGCVVGVRRRLVLPLRLVSLIALLLMVIAAVAGYWGARSVVRDQESRILKERTNEIVAVLTLAVNNLQSNMASLGAVARVTHGSGPAFMDAAGTVLATAQSPTSYALVQRSGDGFVVATTAGKVLTSGQRITGVAAQTIDQAMKQHTFLGTPVIGTGKDRALGFALGGPAAPPNTIVYEQSVLGPVTVTPRTSSQPFSELDVVLYSGTKADKSQLLLTTTLSLPLHGRVRHALMPVGTGPGKWLMGVTAKKPLVGTVAWNMPWYVLGGLLVAAVLIAIAIETVARRRDLAVELYEAEHGIAERLQRSLLPELPRVPGLELAARYLAGGRGQEVGGDWFDVFRVEGEGIGIAIGDVIGHDLAAATAMAQLRSALRAYAWDGAEPAAVVDRLDRMVDNFGLAQLVTVVYGVLTPPDASGERVFRFANAGHLSPLAVDPQGQVQVLDSVASVIIGAPLPSTRAQSEHRLEAGSTLLLFTDGLVELPGTTLDDSLDRLIDTVARQGAGGSAEDLCTAVLNEMTGGTLRDDVALLAVRVLPTR